MTTNSLGKAPISSLAPRAAAQAWLRQGRHVAMATVIETWGSAPVPPGGEMAIAADDAFQGSVSGGCIEADVIAAALDVIATGAPQMLSFGIEDETAWRSGLQCGGKLRVLVARLDRDRALTDFARLAAAEATREPVVTLTNLADGRPTMFTTSEDTPGYVAAFLAKGRSGVLETQNGEVFVHTTTPVPRVAIIGATQISQHLAAMARGIGYDVVVIDPRPAFTTAGSFNAATVQTGWPEDTLRDLTNDPYTAVVALTHIGQIDDEALRIAIRAPCGYVGALGSRKTHAKRIERLKAAGFSDAEISRIRAPIGLDIGAESPGEIAVSILADVVTAFRKSASR